MQMLTMQHVMLYTYSLWFLVCYPSIAVSNEDILHPAGYLQLQDYLLNLQLLLSRLLISAPAEHCFAIITDSIHGSLYDQQFFSVIHGQQANFLLKLSNEEDLLAPHYQTVRVLKQIRNSNCDLHLVTLMNGLQVKRLLHFVNKKRVLNTGSRFVFLYDSRLFEGDMLHIWNNMIASVILKKQFDNSFVISNIAYPNLLNGVVVTRNVMKWTPSKYLKRALLFPDQASDLQAVVLPVVVYEHVPMIMKTLANATRISKTSSAIYHGLEIEIVNALGSALNFIPGFYETTDSRSERWGSELPNGSFTGLIGQITNRSARIGIGDLHSYKKYTDVMDLSWPHSRECLTFLTPESSKDNSWSTLLQPFSPAMWAGVHLSLFLAGSVFYIISAMHSFLLRRPSTEAHVFQGHTNLTVIDSKMYRDVRFRSYLGSLRVQSKEKDLFDSFSDCLLLTYSMLMYVALPRMPRNWPLRVLTGWYWLYCILLAVTYRASLTAILANPAARITIDSLEDLLKSHIIPSVDSSQNKVFFEEAFDEVAQGVGVKIEIVDDIYSVREGIANGKYAYYDNEFFLRHLRQTGKGHNGGGGGDEVLHIMHDCVVNIPVALALEKNSPLKPYIDMYLMRLSEAGLIFKWFKDSVAGLPTEEKMPQEAVMNLTKIWSSFVALFLGYFLGVCAVVGESLHFNYIVKRHPMYDEYNRNLYYNFKRKFPKL